MRPRRWIEHKDAYVAMDKKKVFATFVLPGGKEQGFVGELWHGRSGDGKKSTMTAVFADEEKYPMICQYRFLLSEAQVARITASDRTDCDYVYPGRLEPDGAV